MLSSIQRIENHLLGKRPETVSPSPLPKVDPFTVNSKGIQTRPMTDVFVRFFDEDFRAGFELDKRSEEWKDDMEEKDRKVYKNLFAKVKRAVRFFLFHVDKFPLVPDDPSKYKEVLRRTAADAEERIRHTLEFGDKKISAYTLVNHPNIKDLENNMNLPVNTPEDWQKFFKTKS
ncbi:hypothetical protein SEMRO_370_G128420.1 [Seminavis robusta]|uniref:Uncharacterized protein n=1 Tax=Seminavis robusta TaxID=568900 RepID=A0A9N8DU03_9STRA|nr:hypothetical protein SEMRO_370_G128420.1 [Seminavis robusta]|eukprot:Sro370_g128420.1 n/a (174) ;mRNA; f:22625-23146